MLYVRATSFTRVKPFSYIKVIKRTILKTTIQGVYFIYFFFSYMFRPLLHLKVEYTIILESYFTHNGSVLL
jgi:hypothetical protein